MRHRWRNCHHPLHRPRRHRPHHSSCHRSLVHRPHSWSRTSTRRRRRHSLLHRNERLRSSPPHLRQRRGHLRSHPHFHRSWRRHRCRCSSRRREPKDRSRWLLIAPERSGAGRQRPSAIRCQAALVPQWGRALLSLPAAPDHACAPRASPPSPSPTRSKRTERRRQRRNRRRCGRHRPVHLVVHERRGVLLDPRVVTCGERRRKPCAPEPTTDTTNASNGWTTNARDRPL